MRLLACFAHPDDESFTSAGTLALLARDGHNVTLLTATRGENGRGPDVPPGLSPAGLAAIREQELRAACDVLGLGECRIAGLPDGGVAERRAAFSDAVGTIAAEFRPDVLLTFGPDGAYGHPDHVAAGSATADAFSRTGASRLLAVAYPRGLFGPQYDTMLSTPLADRMGDRRRLGINVGRAELEVGITTVAGVKLEAIGCHRSQLAAGDPRSLFPPGLVEATLTREWFVVVAGLGRGQRLEGPFSGL